MYIVIRHSEAGSIILTRHDDFNVILEEMKLDMEYAYLKEYGGDIKLKVSAILYRWMQKSEICTATLDVAS